MSVLDKLELGKKYILDERFREDSKAVKYAKNGYVHYCVEKLRDLGVTGFLEDGATLEEVIDSTEIQHDEMLEMMLNILVGEDMLAYSDGVYSIRKMETSFTEEQFEWLERNYPYSTEFTMFLLENSEEVLKTGEPIDEAGFESELVEKWDGMMNEFPYSFKKMMLEKMSIEDGDRILELGCGSGSVIEMILENFDKELYITGVDMSQESLEIAEERLQELKQVSDSEIVKENIERITLKQLDLAETIPDGSYDHVISSLVFHHIPEEDREAIIQNIAEMLNDGGNLGIYEYLHRSRFDPVPFWLIHCIPAYEGYPYRDKFLPLLKENFGHIRTYARDSIIIADK